MNKGGERRDEGRREKAGSASPVPQNASQPCAISYPMQHPITEFMYKRCRRTLTVADMRKHSTQYTGDHGCGQVIHPQFGVSVSKFVRPSVRPSRLPSRPPSLPPSTTRRLRSAVRSVRGAAHIIRMVRGMAAMACTKLRGLRCRPDSWEGGEGRGGTEQRAGRGDGLEAPFHNPFTRIVMRLQTYERHS